MRITPAVAELIEREAPTVALAKLAYDEQTPQPGCFGPMWRDGLRKARLGQTTLEEVARVAMIAETETTLETRRAA